MTATVSLRQDDQNSSSANLVEAERISHGLLPLSDQKLTHPSVPITVKAMMTSQKIVMKIPRCTS